MKNELLTLVSNPTNLAKFNSHIQLIIENESFRNYIRYSIEKGLALNPIDEPAYKIAARIVDKASTHK